MVEKAEEGGKLAFVLEDGKRYKSASSAASALMGGKAVNGGASGPSKVRSRRQRKEVTWPAMIPGPAPRFR